MTTKTKIFPTTKCDIEVAWDSEKPPSWQIVQACKDYYCQHGNTGAVVILGWEIALALTHELNERAVSEFKGMPLVVSATALKDSIEVAAKLTVREIVQAASAAGRLDGLGFIPE